MPDYVFYLGGLRIPLYLKADTEEDGEWRYFELQPYKKALLLGLVATTGTLLYQKKYAWAGALVTSLVPLHTLATIIFPRSTPNYLGH